MAEKEIKTAGFTLLELSIVLVIIGLIAGSVLVGRDLIDAARLRTVEAEATSYQMAVNTFYGKYNALPGDIAAPTQLFSTQLWLGGNGNEEIIWTGEGAEAWRQLALAGLIKGLSNTTCASFCIGIPNDTIPGSRGFSTAGWTIMFDTTVRKNILLFGAKSTTGDYMASDPVLTGLQAQAIDKKFDDGFSDTGTVIAKNTTGFTNCTNSGAYDVKETSMACNFSIWLGQ